MTDTDTPILKELVDRLVVSVHRVFGDLVSSKSYIIKDDLWISSQKKKVCNSNQCKKYHKTYKLQWNHSQQQAQNWSNHQKNHRHHTHRQQQNHKIFRFQSTRMAFISVGVQITFTTTHASANRLSFRHLRAKLSHTFTNTKNKSIKWLNLLPQFKLVENQKQWKQHTIHTT